MTIDEAMQGVIDGLDASGIPYMLTGSLALANYGLMRSTHDVDLIVDLKGRTLSGLADKLGPRFRVRPQMAFETITGTIKTEIEVVGTQYVVELFRLTDEPYDQSRFSRRRQHPHQSRLLWIPSAEDAVLAKLLWLRPKDIDDLQTVLGVQWDHLDWSYIEDWAKRLSISDRLAEIRAQVIQLMNEPPP